MKDPFSAPRRALGGPYAIKPTWAATIGKAATPTDAAYRWLLRIADAQAPKVRAAFIKAVNQIRGSVTEAALAAALETGSVQRVLDVLQLDAKIKAALSANVVPPIEDTFIRTGRAVPALGHPSGLLTMRFDIANPKATRFLQQYDFRLIRQIGDDTRVAIQNIVLDAFRYGGHPYEQARTIRDVIGLTDSQAASVANFRRMLTEGDRGAMSRQLRDRRFDPTLDEGLGAAPARPLNASQIETMVERYRSRTLDARATNIARTETLRASNAAQDMAWEQAADNGLLNSRSMRRSWLVTEDDRLCPYCAAVPSMNEGGRAMGEPFDTPLGPVERPPLHPQCRCTLTISNF